MPPAKRKTAVPATETPQDPAKPILVRGLTIAEVEDLEREVQRRRAELARTTPGATLTRNAVVAALLREALAAAKAAT